MGFSLGKALKLPKLSDAIKNPVKTLLRGDSLPVIAGLATAGGLAPTSALGLGLAPLVGGLTSNIKNNVNATMNPPPMQTFSQEPRDLQDRLIKGQLSAADQYSQNLPNAINEETAAKRAELNDQVQNAIRNERGSANARGMLFSGRRLANEGGIQNEAARNLANARSSAIQNMLQREQALYAQPLQSRANVMESNMQHQGALDRLRQQTDAARTAMFQQGAGLIGQGVGKYYANKNEG